MRRENRFALGICIFILAVYVGFRTQNYYWDGIGYALNIEQTAGLGVTLFNPNHLLASLLGWLLYWPLHAVWPGLRAHFMLAAISTILSVATAYLLFRILQRLLRNEYYSACLTLLFAFSATWWKFSTDANMYVPGVFLLMLAADRIMNPHRTLQPVMIGVLHALSMLLHQIAIFFYPAVVTALILRGKPLPARERLRLVGSYTLASSLPVAAVYAWAWFGYVKGIYEFTFWRWMTANAHEEWSFASVGENLWEAIRSTVRLFFGGRFSLAWDHIDGPVLAVLMTMLGASIVLLAAGIIRTIREWFKDEEFLEALPRETKHFIIVWIGSFFLFLFFWLTQFPYYRLFYLPAGILAIGLVLKRYGLLGPLQRTNVVPYFLLVVILSNFSFFIYPYTKVEASPPVKLAREAHRVWRSGAVIYYLEFDGDNAVHKYFNPHTDWRRIDLNSLETFGEEVGEMLRLGKSVWLDRTTLDYLKDSPQTRAWLLTRADFGEKWEFSNRRHRIEYVRLIRKARESSFLFGGIVQALTSFNAEAFEHAVERAAIDLQKLGGPAHVSVKPFDHVQDILPLDFLQ